MKHEMQVAIRAGVCVAMATTSVAVFAGERDESSTAVSQGEKMEATGLSPGTDVEPMKYDEPAGAASGEPTRIDIGKDDDGAKEAAALQEYNQHRFLEETWKALP